MTTDARTLPLGVAAELHAMRAAGDPRWRTYLVALRRRGYSYAALGNAAGISRQRAFQVTQEVPSAEERVLDLPMPPEVDAYPDPRRERAPQPPRALTAADAVELRQLWDDSASRRGKQTANHPSERAHLLLTAMVTLLLRQGWTFPEIADAIKVNQGSFRTRMGRAGLSAREVRAS